MSHTNRRALMTKRVALFATMLATLVAIALPAAAISQSPPPSAVPPTPDNLVLWNKLGSDEEVLHSEVGENGTVVGTAYAYEPAVFDNGYVRKAINANYLAFPATVVDGLRQRGAIEMWIVPKVPNPAPYAYGVFGLTGTPYGWGWGALPQHHSYNLGLHWGDGVTGRGLTGMVGFDAQFVNTPIEAAQFVAVPGVPFHAALVWDIDGIEETNDTVRVYRDGTMVGSSAALWNPAGANLYDIVLGFSPDSGGYDKFITDNLLVWNVAKTDFSGRFQEDPFPNQPPDCSLATPSRAILWPANNKFVALAIQDITDPEGDPITLTITSIFQDEPVGRGNSAPDGQGVGTDWFELRAERLGAGNGRVYHVTFTASDGSGGACTGETLVAVPHDQARPAVDGGTLFDSTVPTP